MTEESKKLSLGDKVKKWLDNGDTRMYLWGGFCIYIGISVCLPLYVSNIRSKEYSKSHVSMQLDISDHLRHEYVIKKLADTNHDGICTKQEMNLLWMKSVGYSYNSFEYSKFYTGEYWNSEANRIIDECIKTRPGETQKYIDEAKNIKVEAIFDRMPKEE